MLQPIHVKRHTDWLYLAGFDRGVTAETREQGPIVTKVESRGIRASVPCREVVVVVGRAYTHLSDTNPLCLPSQSLMDYVSA